MYSHDRTIASAQVIDSLLPDLNADERKLAKEPGMTGRIWFGQGLVFDEAYGILMTLGILTDPKQAAKEGREGGRKYEWPEHQPGLVQPLRTDRQERERNEDQRLIRWIGCGIRWLLMDG